MAFQLSPGVLVKEIDLTNIVPAVATSIGAIAAGFPQGPVEEIIPIGSEQELVNFFGKCGIFLLNFDSIDNGYSGYDAGEFILYLRTNF